MAAPELDALAAQPIRRTTVTADELERALAILGSRWSVHGPDLQLALAGAMTRTGGVAAVAGALADELEHHPRIVLEYAGLTLAIHTHDRQAITVLDLVFAARLEQWLRSRGWG